MTMTGAANATLGDHLSLPSRRTVRPGRATRRRLREEADLRQTEEFLAAIRASTRDDPGPASHCRACDRIKHAIEG
jgi:hypothetical protein